jgi:hypothetical protein
VEGEVTIQHLVNDLGAGGEAGDEAEAFAHQAVALAALLGAGQRRAAVADADMSDEAGVGWLKAGGVDRGFVHTISGRPGAQ